MPSFRESLLRRIDKVRELPHHKFDMRQNTVDLVIRSWSGDVSGVGVKSITTSRLFISGSYNIRVQEVSSKDIVASGGELTSSSLKIGPFTPTYPGGGLDNPSFDPPTTSRPREVFFLIKGHGMGQNGRWFKRQSDHSLRNYSTWLYLDATGEQP